MCFFLILAAEILLAAMAVFGLYCAVFLLCGERGGKYKTAIRIQNINDIRSLESMILQADTSFFSSRREKYALLVDSELDVTDFSHTSKDVLERVYIYKLVEKQTKGSTEEK